ncbi:hypothetical protein ZHAS_00008999 [Anopheles sinensis]|uniref:Uncharacterized protein n=1 Tax=Anopheles sinensis TaxID=74873 RepID=A0A084VTX0_ANOSI|nr:hypothetical protein ZHAS_00008999 [Anopheles sinensis]
MALSDPVIFATVDEDSPFSDEGRQAEGQPNIATGTYQTLDENAFHIALAVAETEKGR